MTSIGAILKVIEIIREELGTFRWASALLRHKPLSMQTHNDGAIVQLGHGPTNQQGRGVIRHYMCPEIEENFNIFFSQKYIFPVEVDDLGHIKV